MNLAETIEFILANFEINKSVMLWGPPGIGKSEAVAQVGAKTNVPVLDLRLSQIEPIDLRGIPVTDEKTKTTTYYTPSYMPQDMESEGILFLDEINQGDQSTKAASYQLVLDRKLGEYTLPPGWRVIAAGNRAKDKALTGKLGTALTSRLVHGYVEPELQDFVTYAVGENFHESVPAFLNFQPEFLHKMDHKTPDTPFPTPRTWKYVSDIIHAHPNDTTLRTNLVKGAVGDGAGIVFLGYMDIYDRVPEWSDIIGDPESIVLNWDQMDYIYALAMKTVYNVSLVDIDDAMVFIERFPEEYQVMIMSILNKKKNELWATPKVLDWAMAHQNSFT